MPKSHKPTLFAICIGFFLFPNLVKAAPVIIDKNLTQIYLGRYFEYYEDKDGAITFEDIKKDRNSHKLNWKQSNADKLGFGFSRSVYWVRFTLKNPTNKMLEIYLNQAYPPIDYIDLYISAEKGIFRLIQTGDHYPFSKRPVEYRSFLFPLRIQARSSKVCYMRFKSSGSMNIQLSVLSHAAFHKFKDNEAILYWMFYGILFVMFIYNLIVFFATMDWSYLYYILYIASFGLFIMSMNGMAYQYLWSNNIWLSNFAVPLTMALIIISIIMFVVKFVGVKNYSLLFYRILMTMVYLAAGSIVLIIITDNYWLAVNGMNILTGIAATFGLFTMVYIGIFKKDRQGRITLASYAAFLFGAMLMVLQLRGILPATPLTTNGVLVGTFLQIVTISYGLADKINRLRKDLAILNFSLENKVQERTEKLNTAMEELETINNTLTETNRELEYAQAIARRDMDMASSVQLTFFPKEPPVVRNWDISFLFKPMTGVSGDFYDFYEENGEIEGLIIFDVSGHGIASGLITMLAKPIFFRNFKQGRDIKLNQILEKVNRELIREMGEVDNYLTGIMLRFNKNIVEYVNAGHSDLILKDGESSKAEFVNPAEGDVKGSLIGTAVMESSYKVHSFSVKNNDVLVLYTDCIYECRNHAGEEYGFARLKESIEMAPDGSAQEILNNISKSFYDFINDSKIIDDLTLIVLKKKSSG